MGLFMEKTSLVSIIIPVYNVEKYLQKCLDSVFNQTYKNIEIIIINDCSTDNSKDIINKLVTKNDHIITNIISNEINLGLSGARNKGLEIAKGDYICFIDSDDWVEQDHVKNMVECIKSNDVDLICSSALVFNDRKRKIEQNTVASDYFSFKFYDPNNLNVNNIVNYAYKNNPLFWVVNAKTILNTYNNFAVVAWGKLFKSEIIKKYTLKFSDGLLFEDNLFTLQYLVYCNDVGFISDYSYDYRVNNSNSLQGSFNKHNDKLKIFTLMEGFLKQHNLWESYKDSMNSFFKEVIYKDILSKKNFNYTFFKECRKYLIAHEEIYFSDKKIASLKENPLKFFIRHKILSLAFIKKLIKTIIKPFRK